MQKSQSKFTKLNVRKKRKKLRVRIVVLSSTKIKNFVKHLNKGLQEIESKLEMKEENKRILAVSRMISKKRKKKIRKSQRIRINKKRSRSLSKSRSRSLSRSRKINI